MYRSTEHERSATMMRMHTLYTEVLVDVTGDMARPVWSDQDLARSKRMVTEP